jgi:hypothetical protein
MIKLRRVRWAGHVACIGKKGSEYRVLAGKPEGKRPLGRHRYRWEGNIQIDLTQDSDQWSAFVNMVINLWVS